MCGIIGYNGTDNAIPYLVEGIKNLEYRGYDSFGCAFDSNGKLSVKKDAGRISSVLSKYPLDGESSNRGIFHTRWATHGEVNRVNAHPQLDCSGNIAVVHNGIIENLEELKNSLQNHRFVSGTDTEVISHLIEEEMKKGKSLENAIISAANKVKGSSSFAVISSADDSIYAVKNGSPLVLGVSGSGTFVSSDVPSFLKYTNKVVFMHDGEIAAIRRNGYSIKSMIGKDQDHPVKTVNFSYEEIDRGRYKHFMEKEILEQPALIRRLLENSLPAIKKASKLINKKATVYISGSGSSFYAASIGANMMIKNGIKSVAVQSQDLPSYRRTMSKNDVVIIVSQSGETADLINSLPSVKDLKKIGLINVKGSTLSNSVDYNIDMSAGQEIAVAATKTFIMSAIILTLLAYYAAGNEEEILPDLKLLSLNVYNIFVPSLYKAIDKAVRILKNKDGLFFIGRGVDYISAQEAALKVKEIAYAHAEAIDGAMFKHGPLALVQRDLYVVSLITKKNASTTSNNIDEIKSRGGKVIGISEESDKSFDFFIRSQPAGVFSFVTQIIISQLLAYKLSIAKGIDPDHPRNLAKSVTVK